MKKKKTLFYLGNIPIFFHPAAKLILKVSQTSPKSQESCTCLSILAFQLLVVFCYHPDDYLSIILDCYYLQIVYCGAVTFLFSNCLAFYQSYSLGSRLFVCSSQCILSCYHVFLKFLGKFY